MSVPPLHFGLILPDESPPYREVNPWPYDASEAIEDEDEDSHALICLYNACRAFTAYGVRFQVRGFFAEPLPVDVEIDLVWFLEHLPGLLTFLDNPTGGVCTVMLMDQGIEATFHFRALDDGTNVEVVALHIPSER